MQGNCFRAQEVVARGDVRWNRDFLFTAVLVEEVVAPGLGGGVIAELEDLEPR